tara:strand:- start:247 stop:1317 length:1071 start_codon:yes stop_codon:yes gene_type:complete
MAVYTTINDGSVHFQNQLYTGNASTNNIVNGGNANLQPDFVWLKNLSTAGKDYGMFDSTRGTTKMLSSNNNNTENTVATSLTSFNTDGFTLGSDGGPNANSSSNVAWQWKANGGTTSSNSSGSITSTVQANTTAGFSIVTYTGNGSSGATIGHGLGAVPDTIILKCRSDSENWFVNTPVGGGVGYMMLNQLNADSGSNSSVWNSTTPTSTLITLGNSGGVNGNSKTYVAYCFKSIQGFSQIGTYYGNGSTNGPFIYTGFKPAWLMIKRTDNSGYWTVFDNKRSASGGDNEITYYLEANANNEQSTGGSVNDVDFLSNGIKIREDNGDLNNSTSPIFYMTFAQNPFVTSDSIPTTAR